eukprot:Sdes_comp23006_c0_seq1m21349
MKGDLLLFGIQSIHAGKNQCVVSESENFQTNCILQLPQWITRIIMQSLHPYLINDRFALTNRLAAQIQAKFPSKSPSSLTRPTVTRGMALSSFDEHVCNWSKRLIP